MKYWEKTLVTTDNTRLQLYCWDNVNQARGIIQIVHGSCEYGLRYDHFAQFLNDKGYIVIASDHRGHGKTALNNNDLGVFAKKNGWNLIINDLKLINDYIYNQYPNLPIIMLGHSMGSFMARHYAILYGSTISGLILTGTAHPNLGLLFIAKLIAIIDQTLIGYKKPDRLLYKLSYATFNRKFKTQNATGHEWLSQDLEVVKQFNDDPLCGQIFSTSAFKDLFKGLLFITKRFNIFKTRKDLPILFLSGKNDPVGGFTKQVTKCYQIYHNFGYHARVKLYPKMRHEILNEIGKEEVYQDILNFCQWITN